MAQKPMRTLGDILDAIMELLKLQSTDLVSRGRIQRDVTRAYINEVMPYGDWPWRRRKVQIQSQPYHATGLASVTLDSVSVTLDTTLANSRTGYSFSVTGENDVYVIKSHVGGSATLILDSPYINHTNATAGFKIWADSVPLPADLEEIKEITCPNLSKPMVGVGLQEYRRIQSTNPKAEGRPFYFTLDDWKDPEPYSLVTGLPTSTFRSATGLVRTVRFASTLGSSEATALLKVGDRIQVSGSSSYSYNIEAIVSSVTTVSAPLDTITFTALESITESSSSDISIVVKKMNSEGYERQKHLLVYPAIYNTKTNLTVDYQCELPAFSDETDEPTMPMADRVVLYWLGLSYAYARERNPEESMLYRQLAEQRMAKMAGRTTESMDKPAILPSNLYLSTKRNAQRYRGRGGSTEPFGAAGGSSSNPTGNTNTVAIFGPNQTLQSSAVTVGDLNTLSDIDNTKQLEGRFVYLENLITNTTYNDLEQTLTNKTLDADLNVIFNIDNDEIKSLAGIQVSKLEALTPNRALLTDVNGFVSPSAVNNVELEYLVGVTDLVQTQLDLKAPLDSPILTTPDIGAATGTSLNLSGLTASSAVATDGSKNLVSVTNTGTGSNVLATSPTLVTPALGTPSALVGTNITGTAAGLTAGTVTTNANLTGVITSVGNATSIASQTGTGTTFVVDTSPTLVTPNLGTPTALVGTNITGTASGLTAGTVTTNANLTGVITSVGNATSIASQTGTGTKFVVDTSPTLVTPVLGVASGTSLNLSGLTVSSAVATDGSKNLVSVTNTGTGNNVLATSPTLVTPALGTPSAAVLTNATGLPLSSGVTGTLPIANGGTGQATKAAAFDALSPMTTGGDLIYGGASGTATRLANGTAGQVLTSAGTTLAPTWADATGGSGSGGINYITNTSATVDTSGWATYADAAQNAPVNGTGGSPSSTWTRTTSTPLRGVGSFLWTRSANNRQGEGVSYDFTIDVADKAKPLAITFDYAIASGTFVAADGITAPLNDGTTSQNAGMSDLEVFVYDVTNSALIPVSPQVLTSSSSLAATFKGTFQTASNSTSYRLIFHTARSTAVAFTAQVDNVIVGPQSVAYGAAISDLGSLPSPTSSITNATLGYYKARRVGDSVEIQAAWNFTGASSLDAIAAAAVLPAGLTVDSAKIAITSNNIYPAGTAYTIDTGVADYNNLTQYIANTNTFNLARNQTNSAPYTPGNTDSVGINIKLPVTGWSSTVQMSNDTDTRVVAAKATVSGTLGVTVDVAIPWSSTTYDTHGGLSGGRYTAPVSGYYQIVASIYDGGNPTVYIWKNGVKVSQGTPVASASQGTAVQDVLQLVAGDIVDIRSGATGTLANAPVLNRFSINRISGPAAVAATETVSCSYGTSAGNTISTSAATTFATKDYDTHSAWDGTNKFTAPVAGKYRVSSVIAMSGVNLSTSQSLDMDLYKNGSRIRHINATYGNGTSQPYRVGGSATVNLVAGDYLQIFTASSVSSALFGNAAYNYVCIERVGN